MISSSIHNINGESLWHDNTRNPKSKKGMMEFSDFGVHMKLWRFEEIKQYVPQVMEYVSLKEVDDWWKYKSWVKRSVENRKKSIFASHILVFDETMSAFVPRFVCVFCNTLLHLV